MCYSFGTQRFAVLAGADSNFIEFDIYLRSTYLLEIFFPLSLQFTNFNMYFLGTHAFKITI